MAARDLHPTNLELQALTVLWNRGPSTVAGVHEALGETKERAYTTVLTVMRNLEAKQLVRHQTSGKAHVFEPACDPVAVRQGAARRFVDDVFGGSLVEALLATLSAGSLSPVEKQAIEQQLKQHRTMPAKKAAKKVAKKAVAKKAAPAKKPVVKKAAPAKKAVVKKAAPAKKAPAKKAAVKKAPAKKVAKKAAKK